MTDVAVILLIRNELPHLRRFMERVAELEPRQVLVVDSPSDDGGDRLAAELGAKVVVHPYPGYQAAQFNWALDNLPIEAGWVLRLDADEYLTHETAARLKAELPRLGSEVAALTLELKRKFLGGEIRHGTNGIRQVRLFRRGCGRYPDTPMDERFVVTGGATVDFDGAFYDDSLRGLEWWREKHRGYARREAAQALEGTSQDVRKASYYRLPPYLRAFAYFGVRYFLKLGFLDGLAGWRWNFWQGLWYRLLVDREIARLRHREGKGKGC